MLCALGEINEASAIVSQLRAWDHRLVHVANGNRLFKVGPGAPSMYLIFERTDHWLRHR